MSERKCITPVGTLSYPHLFTPQAPMPNPDGTPGTGEPKYGAVVIFEEGADLKAMKAAVLVAALEKFGDKAKAMLKGKKLRLPFREDWEEKGYPENSVFINAKTTNPPGIVSRYQDPETEKAQVITDPEVMYPGAQVRLSVTAFGYDVLGNKGVSFALNNVQKWGEGDRLDSRIKAEDEFEAEAPVDADLGDLDGESASEEGDLTDLM